MVTGPEILRKEWDINKTALQNLEKLGLARRPLALRQNGGIEKHVEDVLNEHAHDNAEDASDDDDEDAYASEDDDDNEDDSMMNATSIDDNDTPEAGPSNSHKKPTMEKTSKDIPKGFARIIRDADGNVIDVVMSAYDEPDVPSTQQDEEEDDNEESMEANTNEDDEKTPWGKPLVSKEHEKQLRKAAKPVPAKNAALRELEERTAAERSIKASSLRYASPAEVEYLRSLVKKHGTDIQAMARDYKLNQDQRTAGQLKKAFAKCGGVEAFLA